MLDELIEKVADAVLDGHERLAISELRDRAARLQSVCESLLVEWKPDPRQAVHPPVPASAPAHERARQSVARPSRQLGFDELAGDEAPVLDANVLARLNAEAEAARIGRNRAERRRLERRGRKKGN